MWGHLPKHLMRFLALVALATQALMPGSMAAASTRSSDLPSILCAMPDMQGARSAAGSDLAELITKKSQPDPASSDHDCPACVLAQTALLPELVVLKSPVTGGVAHTAPIFEVQFAHVPRGPPVGSRAPPSSAAL